MGWTGNKTKSIRPSNTTQRARDLFQMVDEKNTWGVHSLLGQWIKTKDMMNDGIHL